MPCEEQSGTKDFGSSKAMESCLQSTLCEAPKELLAGYRAIAVQSTVAFVIVIGWILTSERTQDLIKGSKRFCSWANVGLIAFGGLAIAILFSYYYRSDLAFTQLTKESGIDVRSLLKCYQITWWQLLVTSLLVFCLVAAAMRHLWSVHNGSAAADDTTAGTVTDAKDEEIEIEVR